MRRPPRQKPGRSRQDDGTPRALLAAVEKRFGKLAWDLAASRSNAKAPNFLTLREDSLSADWRVLPGGLRWLNPPFAKISPWAKKCALESGSGGQRILLLVPASVGSDWFAEHVYPFAYVYALQGRLTFEGETDPYPKDCILAAYDGVVTGFEVWDWRRE